MTDLEDSTLYLREKPVEEEKYLLWEVYDIRGTVVAHIMEMNGKVSARTVAGYRLSTIEVKDLYDLMVNVENKTNSR